MGDNIQELMEGADEGAFWEGGGHKYKLEKVVGNGAFGIVWRARTEDAEVVAIKKVLLDRRYHNRELQMMRVMDHECIVRLRHFFEKQGRKKDETYLHLVMDYLPETLRSVALQHHKRRKRFAPEHIKAFLWQTFCALEYIHARRICHRDIKPDNLLVDPSTLKCRLCDFGCSKVIVKGQPNVSYICSRYYRAPELMFGATEYGVGVDVWSVGTILMELMLGHLPFQGQDSTQQHLIEVMKLIGTPSDRDLQAMRSTCCADDLPKLKPFPWDRLFPPGTDPEAIDLTQRLLLYDPDQRLTAPQTLAHPFFDGAQQLVEEASGTPLVSRSGSTAQSSSSSKAVTTAEWEKNLKGYFDALESDGAALDKLEGAMLERIQREMAPAAQKEPASTELAKQVANVVRQELSAGLRLRDEALRNVRQQLVMEAHQYKIMVPMKYKVAPSARADVGQLREELSAVRKEAKKANERAKAEKDELLARIRAVKDELTRMSAPNGGARGDGREAATQTTEEDRPVTPGYGRRAPPAGHVVGLPSRQQSMATIDQQEGMSPGGGRTAAHAQNIMVHTDNMGQVTPLSSFSPLNAQQASSNRSQSGRRQKRLSEGGGADADGGPAPA